MPDFKTILKSKSSDSSEIKSPERKWRWLKLFRKSKNKSQNPLIINEQTDVSRDPFPNETDILNSPSNVDEIVNSDLVCLLCLQIPHQWFTIEKCGCKFCLQCMEMYVHCSVRSGQVPITCPDGHCPHSKREPSHLTPNEVKYLIPSDMHPLFSRLQLNKEVSVNPDLMWCPRPGCETVCQIPKVEKKSKSKLFGVFPRSELAKNRLVTCDGCSFSFCSRCKTPWHGTQPCPTIHSAASHHGQKTFYDDPILVLERDGYVKRCPFCQIPIERDDGCAQMMCKNCHHVFCWFCLASLDDDFMLRHYDSGPCRSRLGHSRLSVIWHRTQVVSAFLGLGIVFLVTSPLILLASPCIMCWRHYPRNSRPNNQGH